MSYFYDYELCEYREIREILGIYFFSSVKYEKGGVTIR
jgi:hypothetical protein